MENESSLRLLETDTSSSDLWKLTNKTTFSGVVRKPGFC